MASLLVPFSVCLPRRPPPQWVAWHLCAQALATLAALPRTSACPGSALEPGLSPQPPAAWTKLARGWGRGQVGQGQGRSHLLPSLSSSLSCTLSLATSCLSGIPPQVWVTMVPSVCFCHGSSLLRNVSAVTSVRCDPAGKALTAVASPVSPFSPGLRHLRPQSGLRVQVSPALDLALGTGGRGWAGAALKRLRPRGTVTATHVQVPLWLSELGAPNFLFCFPSWALRANLW